MWTTPLLVVAAVPALRPWRPLAFGWRLIRASLLIRLTRLLIGLTLLFRALWWTRLLLLALLLLLLRTLLALIALVAPRLRSGRP